MPARSSGPRAFFTFVRKGITDFHQTASIVPSSRFLVEAVADAARPETADVIVELGPGVGPMTELLLARMRPGAKLYTIEIDAPLHDELKKRVRDPRHVPILGSAEDIELLLARHGHVGPVDAVVSGLGLSLLDGSIRDRILAASRKALRKGGRFVQFGYVHTRYFIWTKAGLSRFDYRHVIRRTFGNVSRHPVPANFPPAWVYTAHG